METSQLSKEEEQRQTGQQFVGYLSSDEQVDLNQSIQLDEQVFLVALFTEVTAQFSYLS